MSGRKYSIYVEYFLLPDAVEWKRGRQAYYCFTYVLPTSQIAGFMRGSHHTKYAFKSSIHNRFVAPFRRYAKRKSVTFVQNAIWGWSARTRIMHILNSMYDFNQPTPQTTFADATEILWSNVARASGRGGNYTTARLCRRIVELRAPAVFNKFRNARALQRARLLWRNTKQDEKKWLRGRVFAALHGLKKSLKNSKLSRLRQMRAYSMYRNQLRRTLIAQAVTANTIRCKADIDAEGAASRLYSEVASRLNKKSRRLTLLYLLARQDARKAGKPFKQSILDFCANRSRASRRKQLMAIRSRSLSFRGHRNKKTK